MAKIDDSDLAALRESGPLLRFAAERIKNLDPDLPLAVAEARVAADDNTWSPQISQRFWNAFAKLCDLIQPATMDCIAAAQPNIEPPRWLRYFDRARKSIAERSSSRYLFALLLLLVLILPIQLYVWTCTNLSKRIDDLVAGEKTRYAALVQDFNKLDVDTRTITPESWSVDQKTKASKIITDAISIQDDLDRINSEAYLLERISIGKQAPIVLRKEPTQWHEYFASVAEQFSRTQLRVVEIQERTNLIVGVAGAYILPILFGTIGAVAYIIRSISEQIRTSTFSTTSPTRHIMRAALGAMSGLVVGLFGDLSTKFSLSPLALAFLAGYGVEALFSMFDGFVAKFK